MSIIDSLKSFFSTDNSQKPETASYTEEHDGFTITATPVSESGQYRINGTIVMGEQQHIFIRADLLPSAESCAQETFRKARLMIDQQGQRIFD